MTDEGSFRFCEFFGSKLQKFGCLNANSVQITQSVRKISHVGDSKANADFSRETPRNGGPPSAITPPPPAKIRQTGHQHAKIDYKMAKSWSESFNGLMQSPAGVNLFKAYMKSVHNHCKELEFLEALDFYKCNKNGDWRTRATLLYENFFSNQSHANLRGVAQVSKDGVRRNLDDANGATFDVVKKQILHSLETDEYPKFLESGAYADYTVERIPLLVVRGWSFCFQMMMKYDEGRKLFMSFLVNEHCDELLQFWQRAKAYKKIRESKARQKDAQEIYIKFISSEAETEVCAEGEAKMLIAKTYKEADENLFTQAEKQVYLMLKRDYYGKFCKSKILTDFTTARIAEAKATCSEKIPTHVVVEWSTNFARLMDYDLGRELFREYVRQDKCEENLQFWEAVQIYKTLDRTTEDDRIWCTKRAREIFNEFVNQLSSSEINICVGTREKVKTTYKTGDIDAFQCAEQEIYLLMKRDTFPKFVRSDICKSFVENQFEAQLKILPVEVMQRWAFDFEELVSSDYGRFLFHKFLEKEKSDENLNFWEAVQEYKKLANDEQKRKMLGAEICAEFVSANALSEVNIDDESKKKAKSAMENGDFHAFDMAERQIYALMSKDRFPKFLNSPIFQEFQTKLIDVEAQGLGVQVMKEWATNFEALLKYHAGRLILTNFLKQEHSEENMWFLNDVQLYREMAQRTNQGRRRAKARQIYSDYISNDASYAVNVSSEAKRAVKVNLEAATPTLFDTATRDVRLLLEKDSFHRFAKSAGFAEFLKKHNVHVPQLASESV